MSPPWPATRSSPPSRRFQSVSAVIGEAGALTLTVTGSLDALLQVSDGLGGVGFAVWNSLGVLAFCALLIGLTGLVSSHAAGSGLLAGIGLTTAFSGLVAFAVVRLATFADREFAQFDVIAILMTSIGMLLTGVAVLRARHWHGWHRYMPLVCGLYGGLIELPGSLLLRQDSLLQLVTTGNWLTWVVLGIVMLVTARRPGTRSIR